MNLTLSNHAHPAREVVQNCLGEGLVLLDMRTGNCFELDVVGAQIWTKLREGGALRAAVDHLITLYDVDPETAESDVLALAQDLATSGMLEVVVTPGEVPRA